jgi:hypothetical protein
MTQDDADKRAGPKSRPVVNAADIIALAASMIASKFTDTLSDDAIGDLAFDIAEAMAAAVDDARNAEQSRCEGLIRRFLVYDSQRAVSWHEIQDCLEAIRKEK